MKKCYFLIVAVAIVQLSFGQERSWHLRDFYLKKENGVRIDKIVSVKSKLDTLTRYGFKNGDDTELHSTKVKLLRGQGFSVSNWSYLFNSFHGEQAPFSISTVPFKIRPELDTISISANSGLTNVGLNIHLFERESTRYFINAKKSIHKFYAGFWLSPSVEELDSLRTNGFLKKDVKSKQLFLSTALTLSYSYNHVTFSFVPIGFDIATNSIGREWVYNTRRWWGFGIGIEPKIFGTIVNK
jgi:hypothetical protein